MKNPSKTAQIASCCFLTTLVMNLLQKLVQDTAITASTLVYSLFLLWMAVLLMLAQNRILMAVAAGINLARIYIAYRGIWSYFALYPLVNKVFVLCNILSALFFLLMLIESALPAKSVYSAIRMTWFLPGLMLIFRYAPVWATNDYAGVGMVATVLSILSQLAHVAAFLLTGLWLKQALSLQDAPDNAS